MRLLLGILALLGAVCCVAAWSKEDYEIFDLVSALEAAEGKGVNFYSHLGVDPSASTSELTKAYRKKSLELHPDKNPGVKDIQERFARLGVIAQILRSPEGRERYNFFYKNGVPTWRGTGYYYSRYRPTLSHTIFFLVFLTSLLHLLVMKMNYTRDKKRVDYFEQAARAAAGLSTTKKDKEKEGDGTATPTGRRRKVKVPMVAGSDYSGHLELIVEGEQVFVPHDDGSLEPLSGLATRPSYFRTWPFSLSLSVARRVTAFLPPHIQASLPVMLVTPAHIEDHASGEDQVEPAPPVRNGKKGKKSRDNTPKDSPVVTEAEGDSDEEGEAAGENGDSTAVSKKKKKGLGKAGAARRRKMGMK